MSVQEVICRLCLKVPHNELILIDVATRQGLDVLSVKMNFDLRTLNMSNNPMMCEDCAEIIKRLLSFILTCLDSEKTILLSNTGKDDLNTDFRNVYANNLKEIARGEPYICRFCIKKVEDRNTILQDMLMKGITPHMLGMDQNLVKNLLICNNCGDNVDTYFNFIENCRVTEQKISTYQQNGGTLSGREYSNRHTQTYEVKKEKLLLEDVADFKLIDTNSPIEDVKEFATKDRGSNNSLQQLPLDTQDDVSSNKGTHPQSTFLRFEIDIHDKARKTGSKYIARYETLSRRPRLYRCKLCPYQGSRIKKHMLSHRGISIVTMFKCTDCDFETNRKRSLRAHCSIHKIPPEVKIYECTDCDYKTKDKHALKKHSIIHKTDAEIVMYKCVSCDFKAKRKGDLNRHNLTHKTEAEVTMHKCTTCDYKTKLKNNLKSHLLTHKTIADAALYKCTDCYFTTKYKYYLKKHLATHKN